LLEKQGTIIPNPLLREATFLKGGIPVISELARQQADKYPRHSAFKGDLTRSLKESGLYD